MTQEEYEENQSKLMQMGLVSSGSHNGAKSQGIFCVLALLIGGYGVHNFYANRWGRGLTQLLLTIGTGLIGTLICSLWSIINIFTIETDGDGHPFNLNAPAKYICGVLGISCKTSLRIAAYLPVFASSRDCDSDDVGASFRKGCLRAHGCASGTGAGEGAEFCEEPIGKNSGTSH